MQEAIPKQVIQKKKYSGEELKSDVMYFSTFLVFLSIIFYIISLRLVAKIVKPVEENIDDMKNFIDNAGHELKTPLAVIDSSIQLMNAKKEFNPDLLEKSQKEILRTNKLIETLRDFSNITVISNRQKFNISEAINEIVSKYNTDIIEKKITLEKNIFEDFSIEANKNYFEILFSNILSNAIKYNKEGGKVIITVLNKTLVIEDTGIGIPEKKLKKVFNRFYRVKHSKTVQGFGLGLSIVEKIAKVYKWNVQIEGQEGNGTQVRVKF